MCSRSHFLALKRPFGYVTNYAVKFDKEAVMRFKFLIISLFISGPAFAASPLQCLTEAIYFEASADSDVGRAAVGHTILNRAIDQRFPPSICAVVREGAEEKKCQFSYLCDARPEEMTSADKRKKAKKSAKAILSGMISDPTQGALFFHSTRISPGWFKTRERLGSFGGNIFYR